MLYKSEQEAIHEHNTNISQRRVTPYTPHTSYSSISNTTRQKHEENNAHIRACQSPLPVARMLPAGLRSIEITA